MKDLARKWVGEVDDPKARMNKYEWTRTLAQARSTAMAKHNIERGWEKSGVYPLNNTKVVPPIDNTAAATAPSTPVSNRRRMLLEPSKSLKLEEVKLYRRHQGSMTTPVCKFGRIGLSLTGRA
jgi:hypothetical protein